MPLLKLGNLTGYVKCMFLTSIKGHPPSILYFSAKFVHVQHLHLNNTRQWCICLESVIKLFDLFT